MTLLEDVRDFAHMAADYVIQELRGTAAPGPVCVAGGRPHPATDGRLCRWHLEELAAWLHDIEDEAARLHPDPADPDAWTALPSLATRWDRGGGALASERSPAVLDAIAHTDPRTTAHGWLCVTGPLCASRACGHGSCDLIRSDREELAAHADRLLSVLGVLGGWAQQVRDERMFGRPAEDRFLRFNHRPQYVVRCATRCTHPWCASVGVWMTVPVPPTVASERDLLTRQLAWIARQPWVGEMRRELADLRAQLLRTNHNQDDRPLPGWCFRIEAGVECGGDLWPAEPVHTSGYETADGVRAVVCERNPKHRWEGREIARLALVVDQQRRKDTQ